ncbi:MAG TPA: hypothetical protein VHS57_03935, partial [Acidimicrobiales bacterium]|nr:hypothetical protein [Acidimicrobiales bacterium]
VTLGATVVGVVPAPPEECDDTSDVSELVAPGAARGAVVVVVADPDDDAPWADPAGAGGAVPAWCASLAAPSATVGG